MSGALSWNFVQDGPEQRLVLEGSITEETDFAPLLEEIARETVRLDLGGVTRINSCGVREWMEFVSALNERGVSLVLERCSPLIVTQLNLISNFAGQSGAVRSIMAPYFCSQCDDEHLKYVELNGPIELEESTPCPGCGGEMEFDDLPEAYLSFRNKQS